MSSGSAGSNHHHGHWTWRSVQWWPSLAGVAFAAFVTLDLFDGSENGVDLAPVVVASGFVYLAAAAVGTPWIAWPAFVLSVVIITLAKVGVAEINSTWLLLGAAALFLFYGLLPRAIGRAAGLPMQTIAMAAFGAAGVVALFVNSTLGAYIVAAGLLAHAGWDVYHHRANKIVLRSLAEFCFVLDVVLAAIIVFLTVRA